MTVIRSVVNTNLRCVPSFFLQNELNQLILHICFIKLLCVLKKAVANKCLSESREVIRDIKSHHAEHGDLSTHESIFTGSYSKIKCV